MADSDRITPATTPPRTIDDERAVMDKKSMAPEMGATGDPRFPPARPDPETGEVRAGLGDAGLEDRPEVNPARFGDKQMSNRRLVIGLGIGALLAVLVLIFNALF